MYKKGCCKRQKTYSILLTLPNELWINVIQYINATDIPTVYKLKPDLFTLATDSSSMCYFTNKLMSNDSGLIPFNSGGMRDNSLTEKGHFVLMEIHHIGLILINIQRFTNLYRNKKLFIAILDPFNFTRCSDSDKSDPLTGFPYSSECTRFMIKGEDIVSSSSGELNNSVYQMKMMGLFFNYLFEKLPFLGCVFPMVQSLTYVAPHLLQNGCYIDGVSIHDVPHPIFDSKIEFPKLKRLKFDDTPSRSHHAFRPDYLYNLPGLTLHHLASLSLETDVTLLEKFDLPALRYLHLCVSYSPGGNTEICLNDINTPNLKNFHLEIISNTPLKFCSNRFNRKRLEFLRFETDWTSRGSPHADTCSQSDSEILRGIIFSEYGTPNLKHAEVISKIHPSIIYDILNVMKLESLSIQDCSQEKFISFDNEKISVFNKLNSVNYHITSSFIDPFVHILAPSVTSVYLNFQSNYQFEVLKYIKSMKKSFPNVRNLVITGSPISLDDNKSKTLTNASPEELGNYNNEIALDIELLKVGTREGYGTKFDFEKLFKNIEFTNLRKLIIYHGHYQESIPKILINAPNLEVIDYRVSEKGPIHSALIIYTSLLPSFKKLIKGKLETILLPDMQGEKELYSKIEVEARSPYWKIRFGYDAKEYIRSLCSKSINHVEFSSEDEDNDNYSEHDEVDDDDDESINEEDSLDYVKIIRRRNGLGWEPEMYHWFH